MTILKYLTPFTEKEPIEGIDLFVCEDTETVRRYGVLRYFKKNAMFPHHYTDDKTPEERLLEAIYHEPKEDLFAPSTGYYRCVRKNAEDRNGKWIKSCINPLDSSYIAINPEEVEESD